MTKSKKNYVLYVCWNVQKMFGLWCIYFYYLIINLLLFLIMILAVYKPIWITSFKVISYLRKFFWETKIWHCGTLDPLASWLLLIGVWSWTKQLSNLIWLDKEYIATIDFSKDSDTWDMEYRNWFEQFKLFKKDNEQMLEIWSRQLVAPSLEAIRDKINLLIPWYDLPLTPFSSKKVDGKRFYELARKGRPINETRYMKVDSIDIIEYNFPELKVKIKVWSGTYIRSIAHWLWQEFDMWWILTWLERISVWQYSLDDFQMQEVWDTGVRFKEISK